MVKRGGNDDNDEDVDAAFDKAFELRDAGRSREAIIAFRTILSKHPKEVAGWLVLGGLLRDAREYPEAIECLRQAVTLRPSLALASRGLFHTLLNAGHDTEAIVEARRFLALASTGSVKTFPSDLQSLYEEYDREGAELARLWRANKN